MTGNIFTICYVNWGPGVKMWIFADKTREECASCDHLLKSNETFHTQ